MGNWGDTVEGNNLATSRQILPEIYVQHSDYSPQYRIVDFKVAERLDLNSSHLKKK